LQRLLQQIRPGTIEQDVAASDRRGHRISASLDAVGQNGIIRAVKLLAPLHPKRRRADPLDAGAHSDQTIGKIADLRLSCRVLDQALAFG
jgi:hypothetical protein